ncbi:MAG TPA: DUF2961 domain-containing protein, partial [Pirellulales bacterium]|nr:DUF2961 domain-containing protein [Pirellulales bacterium]
QNDDLWLEIAVDGEESPALAAPVRYFFPGLEQGKNYQNFVVLSKHGFVNRLAIPYTQGISFSVVNRGRRAVKDLELTVAWDPSYRVDDGPRGSLHGCFLRESQADVLFPIPVRLVGIVCAEHPDQPDGPVHFGLEFDDPGVSTLSWEGRGEMLGLAVGAKEVRQTLNGRSGGLAWRWWLLGPPEIKGLIQETAATLGDRMIYYYAPRGAVPVALPE